MNITVIDRRKGLPSSCHRLMPWSYPQAAALALCTGEITASAKNQTTQRKGNLLYTRNFLPAMSLQQWSSVLECS